MAISVMIEGLVVNTAPTTSTAIRYSDMDGGRFHVPTGSSVTAVTWYDAPEWGGTFVPAHDADGLAITQTVAAERSYEIPPSLYGAQAIMPVTDAAGTVDVTLKRR